MRIGTRWTSAKRESPPEIEDIATGKLQWQKVLAQAA